MMGQGGYQEDSSGTYNWLVIDTIKMMRNAKAAEEIQKYYVHFKFALQMLLPFIALEKRRILEDAHKDLLEKEEEVKKKQGSNDLSLKIELNRLHYRFADENEFYIMEALPRAGIIKPMDEGLIDLNREDIPMEAIEAIVRRGGRGTASSIKAVMEKGGAPPAKGGP